MGCRASNYSQVFRAWSYECRLLPFTLCSDITNSLIEICIGIMCSCMPSLARELRQHASPFAMLQSFFSLPFKYFSNRHSRSVPTAESGSPPRYQLKTKKKYLELEVGMSQFGGSDETSSEGSQQCNLESLGTKHFKTFDGEEDRIHLRQEVTVSRQ